MKREEKAALLTTVLCVGLMVLLAILLSPVPTTMPEQEPESTTLTLVYAYQNSQWNACIEEVIRRFEQLHPDVDVSYEIRYEDSVYEDMLYKLAARGELGDIVQLKEPYAWADAGLIAPLSGSLADMAAPSCVRDGKTYALCALGSTTGVIYNKALFEAHGLSVPGTYEEFLSLCAALERLGITPIGLGGKDLWHFEYWANHFLRANVLSEVPDFLALCSSGERDWNDPLVTGMLCDLNGLFCLGYVDSAWPATPDSALAYHMVKGEVAMVFSGPWLASDALNLDPGCELGWFYVPNAAGQVIAGENLDVFWAVTAGCARDEARCEAATAFLEFFYSDGVYEEIFSAMAGYSTRTDHDGDRLPADGIALEVADAMQKADLRFSAYIGDENTPPGFEKKLLELLSEMCAGELTVEETQAEACRCWDECLSQEVAYAN